MIFFLASFVILLHYVVLCSFQPLLQAGISLGILMISIILLYRGKTRTSYHAECILSLAWPVVNHYFLLALKIFNKEKRLAKEIGKGQKWE